MHPAGPSASQGSATPTAGTSDLARRCERLEAEVRELRALAAHLLDHQEDERRDLARALHDGAGGSITAVRMSAHAAMAEDDPAQRNADLADVLAQAGDALDRIRALCARLRPPPLDAVGLEAALRWHVERLDRGHGRVALRIAALPQRPPPAIEQACFRIAEEALASALRHAGPGAVALVLETSGDLLRLEVGSAGEGVDTGMPDGSGLTAMRERARSVGGTLEVSSRQGTGTRVLAMLPVR